MVVNEFNDNEIKEIFNLYNYGFSIIEITNIFNGESIEKIIEEKIKTIVMKIQKYNENLGIEFENINLYEELLDNNKKHIIDSLNNLKQGVKSKIDNTIKEWFENDIKVVINIIRNYKKIKDDIKNNIRLKDDKIDDLNNILKNPTYMGKYEKK